MPKVPADADPLDDIAEKAIGRAKDDTFRANAFAAGFRVRLQLECPALVPAFDEVIASWRTSRQSWVDGIKEIYDA
jgi:hypothetical protein